jgi:hypothetical protein
MEQHSSLLQQIGKFLKIVQFFGLAKKINFFSIFHLTDMSHPERPKTLKII